MSIFGVTLARPGRFAVFLVAYICIVSLASTVIERNGFTSPWVVLWITLCAIGGALLLGMFNCFERTERFS